MKALIFDLDGVVADTAAAHARSWARLADEAGFVFDDRLRAAVLGRTRGDSLDLVLQTRQVDPAERARLLDRKQRYFLEALATLGPVDILPGVEALLDEAQAARLPVGLASSSSNARAVLAQLELTERFPIIGDAFSVAHPKPAPDIFIWVAAALGVQPRECIVLEDAQAGIDAARAAGCRVVALGIDADADFVLPSLDGVRLEHFA